MADKQKYLNWLDEHAELFADVSDKIWGYAELSLMEYQSCELYVKLLKEEGFTVETPVANIQTGFKATYGSGKPVIGILAEYDALSGLSQIAGATKREELVKNGTGHGCGHNMLGAGAMAAAYGIKKYLEDAGEGHGTVIFFGCPGEEGGAAKAFYARDHVFDGVDIALTWHPGDTNGVRSGSCNSCIQTEYRFTGIASHAAGGPEKGRSALDAVELMNIGVQFLREHMPDKDRIHYAITDAGGNSPNVVQPHARVLYMVRSELAKNVKALQARVDKIAEAAAMMTETKMEKRFIDGCGNTVPNKTLEELMDKNFHLVGAPSYTEEEIAYAQKIVDGYEFPREGLPGRGESFDDPAIQKVIAELSDNGQKVLNDFIMPYVYTRQMSPGSTDVGDVSWCVPTAQCGAVGFVSGAPGHSWQNVSSGCTSIGHKGVITAGKVLAATAIDLYENPSIVQAAKDEFESIVVPEGGYVCLVPDDAVPTKLEDPWD
jgi:aminobenzoyl-glutamate utilization protein B